MGTMLMHIIFTLSLSDPTTLEAGDLNAFPWSIPDLCTDVDDLSTKAISEMCEAFPFGRPPGCGEPATPEFCTKLIDLIDGCGITTCDYKACVIAMSDENTCLKPPPECENIGECLLSINGPLPGDDPFGISDTIRACAPDPDVCNKIADACIADGVDAPTCKAVGDNLCPGNKYMSCNAAQTICEQETGGDCKRLVATCDDNFGACPFPACAMAGTLTTAAAVAFCFAHPGRLEQCGAEPDVSDCLSLMTWKGCGVTTCEWTACMDDLEELGNQCPVVFPESCTKIRECEKAEQKGAAAQGPSHVFNPPWRAPLNCCELHGTVPGQPNTCGLSEGNVCVGCDYEPVPCMDLGCSEPDAEDCCVDADGKTIPC